MKDCGCYVKLHRRQKPFFSKIVLGAKIVLGVVYHTQNITDVAPNLAMVSKCWWCLPSLTRMPRTAEEQSTYFLHSACSFFFVYSLFLLTGVCILFLLKYVIFIFLSAFIYIIIIIIIITMIIIIIISYE